jgi:hypothetical protein
VPDVATNSKHHPYCFPIFLLFFCYFSFAKECISIFGNAPWTLKAVPQHYHQQWALSSLFSLFFRGLSDALGMNSKNCQIWQVLMKIAIKSERK